MQRRRADIRATWTRHAVPRGPADRRSDYSLSPAYQALFDDVLAYARETVRDADGGALRQRVRYWSALALLRALASCPARRPRR